jgi:hypothetical protein
LLTKEGSVISLTNKSITKTKAQWTVEHSSIGMMALISVVASTHFYIVANATIPVGGSLVVAGLEQKLVLESSDYLTVSSSLNDSTDIIVSVLEIS